MQSGPAWTQRGEREGEWALEQGEDLDSGRGHRHKVNAKVKSGLREITNLLCLLLSVFI